MEDFGSDVEEIVAAQEAYQKLVKKLQNDRQAKAAAQLAQQQASATNATTTTADSRCVSLYIFLRLPEAYIIRNLLIVFFSIPVLKPVKRLKVTRRIRLTLLPTTRLAMALSKDSKVIPVIKGTQGGRDTSNTARRQRGLARVVTIPSSTVNSSSIIVVANIEGAYS